VTAVYVPGTQEKDISKVIKSLQGVAGAQATDETNIATNTSGLAALQAILPASGQVVFPAVQNPSSNPNVLDDYEEGTWTPGLTFATPGNLSIAYSLQNGYYTKVGRFITVSFAMVTSTFTWTTASGNFLLSGLPFTPNATDASYRSYSPVLFSGINKASYSSVVAAALGNNANMQLLACGMGQAVANLVAADVPTAGTVAIGGNMNYVV
jgi:hypothetical protein